MLSILKRSDQYIMIAGILLLITIVLLAAGCTQKNEAVSSDEDMENILIGAVDVEGSGVNITIMETLTHDSKNQEGQSLKIVHDMDLIKIVNLLSNAGAEVISINDERLISTSEIKADQNSIQINDNRYTGPSFTIKAIGNSEDLNCALTEDDSYIKLLEKDLDVSIEKVDTLFIPKYNGKLDFRYAKPAKGE